MDRDATIASLTAQAAECVAFWQSAGVDIRGYNIVESARDLDALRQHLGVPRISLGESATALISRSRRTR
jgi:hypothetical protein